MLVFLKIRKKKEIKGRREIVILWRSRGPNASEAQSRKPAWPMCVHLPKPACSRPWSDLARPPRSRSRNPVRLKIPLRPGPSVQPLIRSAQAAPGPHLKLQQLLTNRPSKGILSGLPSLIRPVCEVHAQPINSFLIWPSALIKRPLSNWKIPIKNIIFQQLSKTEIKQKIYIFLP